MRTRESKEVPHCLTKRMEQFVSSLPDDKVQRDQILMKYQFFKGYQFLNPKFRINRIFSQKLQSRFGYQSLLNKKNGKDSLSSKYNMSIETQNFGFKNQSEDNNPQIDRTEDQMEEEIRISMLGNLSDISVGGMCEVVKDYMRQECPAYFPAPNQSFLQEFTYTKDKQLTDKVNKVMHSIKLTTLELNQSKYEKQPGNEQTSQRPTHSKMGQFRKQMTIGIDGSLGSWGGKKYEGLGTNNEFRDFRREISQNYYTKSNQEKKK